MSQKREPKRERDSDHQNLVDKLVHVNRVTKVVKGGRRFAFAALVVVGDQAGRVGFGHGRSKEVSDAVRKATEIAKRRMIRVPLREKRTLHHDIMGRFGASRVFLRSADPGTGIIAGGAVRSIFEVLGLQDVVAKSTGSSNSYNLVFAAFDALKKQQNPKSVAQRRGKKVSEIFSHSSKKTPVSQLKDGGIDGPKALED